MVKQIIWSATAQKNRRDIFTYWNNRNKSRSYSKKLNVLFKETLILLSKYPLLGKAVKDSELRVKILKDYLIIYEIDDEHLYILTIWDSRQNPDSLNVLLHK
jgi:toxin YoeB